MLSQYDAIPTLPTSNLQKARQFYEGTLGFVPHVIENEGVLYSAGSDMFLLYPSGFAGTNRATSMSFQVPAEAFDEEVAELRRRGIVLDEFEFEDAVWEDGVMSYGEEKGVWFRDPDGNTIAVETHRLQRRTKRG
jgi:catechol 2,3-dioxygenase-like lactoylglutathione lyase family enzyme